MIQLLMIDISSLENALKQLKESLIYANSQLAKDPGLAKQFRSSSIQSFEYTYELAHKMLKRYLENVSASTANIDEMSFQQLIRTGAEQGLLLNSWDKWKLYRKSRGATSHTYAENIAQEVFEDIPDFVEEVEFLIQQINNRQSET